jgi:hypothetical protein
LTAAKSSPPRWRPLGISRSFRVPPGEVLCLLVPRSRFAVSHFLGCAVFLRRAALATLSDQCNLSSSSAFLQSLEQSCPSRPAAAGQLLSWAFIPYSTPGFGGPLPQALPQPATFRPQGLVTLSTAYSLRALAGLLSCRRRSWDSPFGAFSFRQVPAAFPQPVNPHAVFPVGFPSRRSGRAGPTGRGSWAFTLPGVPGDRCRISAATTGCSLGLCPSRVFRRQPCTGSHPRSSHALRNARRSGHPLRHGVSVGRRLASSTCPAKAVQPDETTLLGFWHLCVPGHLSAAAVRAICFTSRRAVHRCRQTNALWTAYYALPELPGIDLEVPTYTG